MADVTESHHPVLSVKVADNSRQSDGNTGWIGMPFMNLYRSYNKSFSDNNTSKVASKHLKGGKEPKMDVLVMENLLFKRNVTRLYDLKGSSRSRYNPDASGKNKVLLDQNLIEAMPTSPIFLGTKAKRLLERAVWNDTSFLASNDSATVNSPKQIQESGSEKLFRRTSLWSPPTIIPSLIWRACMVEELLMIVICA